MSPRIIFEQELSELLEQLEEMFGEDFKNKVECVKLQKLERLQERLGGC